MKDVKCEHKRKSRRNKKKIIIRILLFGHYQRKTEKLIEDYRGGNLGGKENERKTSRQMLSSNYGGWIQ